MSVSNLAIKNLSIKGFKSLQDLNIRLNKGLNIIIGDNGSGKSNFLEFIEESISSDFNEYRYKRRIRDAFSSNATTYSFDFEYDYRGDSYLFQIKSFTNRIKNSKEIFAVSKNFVISKYKNGKRVYKDLEINVSDKAKQNIDDKNFILFVSEIEKLEMGYNIDKVGFALPNILAYITYPDKITITENALSSFESDGLISSLFISLEIELDDFLSKYKTLRGLTPESIKSLLFEKFKKNKTARKISAYLKKYTPIADIKLNENITVFKDENGFIIENVSLNFKVDKKWMPWSYLSDGTKRMFYLISETVNDSSKIILVEEPELGIHPQQLFKLMTFLKDISFDRQVIITTHSPIALDTVGLNELDSIIIARLTKEGTKMSHLIDVQKSKAKAYIRKVGSLSQYWINSDLEK